MLRHFERFRESELDIVRTLPGRIHHLDEVGEGRNIMRPPFFPGSVRVGIDRDDEGAANLPFELLVAAEVQAVLLPDEAEVRTRRTVIPAAAVAGLVVESILVRIVDAPDSDDDLALRDRLRISRVDDARVRKHDLRDRDREDVRRNELELRSANARVVQESSFRAKARQMIIMENLLFVNEKTYENKKRGTRRTRSAGALCRSRGCACDDAF